MDSLLFHISDTEQLCDPWNLNESEIFIHNDYALMTTNNGSIVEDDCGWMGHYTESTFDFNIFDPYMTCYEKKESNNINSIENKALSKPTKSNNETKTQYDTNNGKTTYDLSVNISSVVTHKNIHESTRQKPPAVSDCMQNGSVDDASKINVEQILITEIEPPKLQLMIFSGKILNIVQENIECDGFADDQSVSTDEILNNAMHLQNYSNQENQRLQNMIHILHEIARRQCEELHNLRQNVVNDDIQMSSTNFNFDFNDNKDPGSDVECTHSLQADSYSYINDLEKKMENDAKGDDDESSPGATDLLEQITTQNMSLFEYKSDLTYENLQTWNEVNSIDFSSESDSLHDFHGDISDADSESTDVAMPNPYDMLPSLLMSPNNSPFQYDKLDTMYSDRGNMYYHSNILPEMMQKLNDSQQRLEELIQTSQNQQMHGIVMNIFTNAWDCYFVICICLISNDAFKNFYSFLYHSIKLYHFLMGNGSN